MATTWNQGCSLCGQFVAASDREQMLEATTWQWDERLVDEALVDRHFCVDRDPTGARQWQRAADAGEMAIELDWLIALELERRQAAPVAAWAVFTTSTMVMGRPGQSVAMPCRGPASGPLRAELERMQDPFSATWVSRSPP